ncbi:MAG: hypothetical protein KC492_35185 [Myxococcales bacterium]|nr:hypothetical protein [Myxococcales bacterium]
MTRLSHLGWLLTSGAVALACAESSGSGVAQTSGGAGGSAGNNATGATAGVAGSASVGGSAAQGGNAGSGGALDGGMDAAGAGGAPWDGGSTDATAIKAFLDQAYADLKLSCDQAQPCCAAAGKGYDKQSCEDGLASGLDIEKGRVDDNLALGAAFDEVAAAECMEARKAALDTCARLTPEVCERVWNGPRKIGEPCEDVAQCEKIPGKQVSCYSLNGSHVCAERTRAKLGEACTRSCWEHRGNIICSNPKPEAAASEAYCYKSDGLYCSAGKCVATGTLAQTCSSGPFSCADPLVCDSSTSECTSQDYACGGCSSDSYCDTDGSCKPKLADFVACTEHYQCTSGDCGFNGCGSGLWPRWLMYCQ